MAAAKSDNRALEMLLEDPRNKADVNAVVKSDARTALHICVVKRNLEGVELLLGQRDIEVNFELRSSVRSMQEKYLFFCKSLHQW